MRESTVEIKEVQEIRGVPYPTDVRFRQLLVTGPPCSGKSTLIAQLRGWPEEGYLDLSRNRWWRDRILTYRPREVHLGLPFVGHGESRSVFDREWLDSPTQLARGRLYVPPEKRSFFQLNWRQRYVFDFQLPSSRSVFEIRVARAKAGTHPVDDGVLSLDQVERQIGVYWELAGFLHANGLSVIVRTEFGGEPRRIVTPGSRGGSSQE